jgi:protein tyrosine/serine phosphatase
MSAAQTGWTNRRHRARGPRAALLRSLKALALTLGLAGGAVGAYWGGLQYQGNFHTVSPGTLYRSAQPSAADLRAAVRDYGIKSVLNLRGANHGSAWYDDEIATSRDLALAHYDIALSAKRFVPAAQIGEILDVLRRAPKPLLVHCKSGADRAGLVAALYRFAEGGATAEEAAGELSLLYGHFPYLTSRSGAMDASLQAFVAGGARRP